MVSPLWKNSFDIFVVALQKHFVYDKSLKVMILLQIPDVKQQNPRDTAPLRMKRAKTQRGLKLSLLKTKQLPKYYPTWMRFSFIYSDFVFMNVANS